MPIIRADLAQLHRNHVPEFPPQELRKKILHTKAFGAVVLDGFLIFTMHKS